MKTLLLMRHGKSSWKDTDLPDRDRPLKKRGRKDTARMAHLLKKNDKIPDLILSSTAARARETAEIFVNESGFDGKVEYLDTLYMLEADALLPLIKEHGNGFKRLMVIGHNPGLESALQIYCREVACLPTASIAYIKFKVKEWKDLNKDNRGDLIDLWSPRQLD